MAGGNMAAVHLAKRGGRQRVPRLHLGGGVRPASILAVVAGLALAGRIGRVARPVRDRVQEEGQRDEGAGELRVSRMTTVVLGIVAVVLGIVFEKQNIAFSGVACVRPSPRRPTSPCSSCLSVLWGGCRRAARRRRLPRAPFGGAANGALEGGVGGRVSLRERCAVSVRVASALFDGARLHRDLGVLCNRQRRPGRAWTRPVSEAQTVRSETGIGAVESRGALMFA